MNKIIETQDGYELEVDIQHSVVAKPVVDTVEVTGLPVKAKLAGALVSALSAAAYRDLPETLSVDRVAEALESLIYIRVLQVRHTWVKGHDELHYRHISYPAFMFPIIRSIGDVVDEEEGIHLKVEAGGSLKRFAKKDYDWSLVVETLRDLRSYGLKNGLEMARAIPKQKDGQLSVMTFLIEGSRLVSHTNRKTPADAVLRAALEFSFSDYVWGKPRWEYNSVEYYHSHLARVVTDTIRGYY